MRPTPFGTVVFVVAFAILGRSAHAQTSVVCPDGSVAIPAATVHVGHGATPPWADHVETIAAFCIDRDELSIDRLQTCVAAGACSANQVCASPVAPAASCLTALEADEVCRAWGGSLPTEAQWEYSARGIDRRDYPSGATAPAWSGLPQLPVVVEDAADRSPFGLVHMLSNAAEWTKSISPAASQVMRIVKGSRGALQPLWARAFLEEHTRARDVGFRCAYPVNTTTPAFVTRP